LGVKRDIADLIDHEQRDPLQAREFVVEVAVALRVGEQRDPFGGGAERDAVAGQAGADPERDAQVCLAGPGRVDVELLMLLIRCRNGCGWWRRREVCVTSSWRCLGGVAGMASWF